MHLSITYPTNRDIEDLGGEVLASHGGTLGIIIAIYFYSKRSCQKYDVGFR